MNSSNLNTQVGFITIQAEHFGLFKKKTKKKKREEKEGRTNINLSTMAILSQMNNLNHKI